MGNTDFIISNLILENTFLNDPELQDGVPTSFLSHKEVYEDSLRKGVLILQKLRKLEEQGLIGYIMGLHVIGGMISKAIIKEGTPMALHTAMFIPAIEGHANEQQQARWLEKAK